MAPSIPAPRAVLAAPALLLLLGALGACGDQEGTAAPDPAPSETPGASETPSQTPSEDGGESCLGVSAADLAEWTGTEQVLDEVDDADPEQAACSTDYDGTGLTVEWSVRPTIGSFEVEGEDAQLNGLDREQVELDGALPAWQLTGVVSGNRLASVVTVLEGDRTLVVEAGDDGDADATFTDEQMDDVVVEVAQAVAEELGA